jgi:hypothetical protein
LPADVWGTILENELSRKQPIAIRTRWNSIYWSEELKISQNTLTTTWC